MATKHRKQTAVNDRVTAELDSSATAEYGGPRRLDLSLIDEDPGQPRTKDNPGFSRASLEELAATIRLRGVKTPISVRDNPDAPGRFIINHGARRFRGSRLAGKTSIPAFVDNDYNDVDQVIENLQRNELTAREIAEFIGRELAKGRRKGEIALSIGKSAAFVSQHAALLDLPDPIAMAFNAGHVKDVTVVNELVKAHRMMPQDVEGWLADGAQDITRGSVRLLREFLNQKLGSGEMQGPDEAVPSPHDEPVPAARPREPATAVARLRSPVVRVNHQGRHARLLLHRAPSVEGAAWLRYEDDHDEVEADLAQVRLVALISAT